MFRRRYFTGRIEHPGGIVDIPLPNAVRPRPRTLADLVHFPIPAPGIQRQRQMLRLPIPFFLRESAGERARGKEKLPSSCQTRRTRVPFGFTSGCDKLAGLVVFGRAEPLAAA